ncbi:hypothetical protein CHARACLAT_005441 [Characodon lateralis]|uniref:Uncharacterized protein n=1 Tax=Characodon lateralis TaxID=208331 RepID=A0ABU7EBH6_9TELE|nr:hypothetical protein [Characodon lateralis]
MLGNITRGICILPWGQWCCSDSLRSSTSLRIDRVPEASSVTFLCSRLVMARHNFHLSAKEATRTKNGLLY